MSMSSPANLPAETSALRQPRRLSEVSVQVLGMTALLFILLLVTRAKNPNILGAYNLQTMGRDIAILSLFALGQAIVLISGGIDLSVGSVMCFVGLNAILLLSPEYGRAWPLYAVLPLALLFATGVGVLHGALVCFMRLPPFMVTLCSLLVFRSIARGITGDTTVSYRSSELPGFDFLGHGMLPLLGRIQLGRLALGPIGIPIPVVILALAVAAVLFLMHMTVHGRYLYAIGYNLEAARFSAVRIHRLRIMAYAIAGFLAGLAGLIEASTINSVAPSTSGSAYELYGITAAVLGGCALRGGQGSILGVVVGAAILRVLQRMIVFLNLSTHYTDAVIGLVLLAAVIADALVKRRRGY